MKAIDGRLKINQSYTIIKSIYAGKYDGGIPSMCCDNCDKPISNIAVVEGSNDKKHYHIGLDCASALTGITPSEIAQTKKELAKKAKFLKWIALELVSFIVMDGTAYLYDKELDRPEYSESNLRHWASWRCNFEIFGDYLPSGKRYEVDSTSEKSYEYSDGTYEVYTLKKLV